MWWQKCFIFILFIWHFCILENYFLLVNFMLIFQRFCLYIKMIHGYFSLFSPLLSHEGHVSVDGQWSYTDFHFEPSAFGFLPCILCYWALMSISCNMTIWVWSTNHCRQKKNQNDSYNNFVFLLNFKYLVYVST